MFPPASPPMQSTPASALPTAVTVLPHPTPAHATFAPLPTPSQPQPFALRKHSSSPLQGVGGGPRSQGHALATNRADNTIGYMGEKPRSGEQDTIVEELKKEMEGVKINYEEIKAVQSRAEVEAVGGRKNLGEIKTMLSWTREELLCVALMLSEGEKPMEACRKAVGKAKWDSLGACGRRSAKKMEAEHVSRLREVKEEMEAIKERARMRGLMGVIERREICAKVARKGVGNRRLKITASDVLKAVELDGRQDPESILAKVEEKGGVVNVMNVLGMFSYQGEEPKRNSEVEVEEVGRKEGGV
jgi:hypothetical protein